MESSPQAFVLMPFDDMYLPVYERLIKEPLEGVGFNVRRADSLLNQQNILSDVVTGIADAALVVADVTGLNENVLYELGLAHALGSRVIMLTQDLSELPFDLRPYRANEYSVEFDKADELKVLMRDVGNAVLEGVAEFSNPVQDFAPDALAERGGVQNSDDYTGALAGEGSNGAPQGPDTQANTMAVEEPGWLEVLENMQTRGQDVYEAAQHITELTESIGNKITRHAEALSEVQEREGRGASAGMLTVVHRSAGDLDSFADSVGPARAALNESLQALANDATSLARHTPISNGEDLEAAKSLMDSVESATETMGESAMSTLGFAESLAQVPHVHRKLTNSSKRASKEVEDTAEVIMNAEAELGRIRDLLAQRIASFERHGEA